MNEELESKIKDMSYEQLISFSNIAIAINGVVHLLGIGTILLVLNFPGIFLSFAGGVVVYILSNLSSGMGETRKYVRERIDSFKKKS